MKDPNMKDNGISAKLTSVCDCFHYKFTIFEVKFI